MTTIVTHRPVHRRTPTARTTFVLVVVLAHLVLIRLMIDARVRSWRVDPPSTPAVTTWNILESNDAPPARSRLDPKASPIQVNIDAPTIEVEEPTPVAAGLGATLPIDPYAGAAPMRVGMVPPPSLLPTASRVAPKHEAPKIAGDDPFSRWVAGLRARLALTLATETILLKSVRAEVLAQPAGGFTTARIAQGSGDVVVDRQVLVDVMHHPELVERGMVATPRWFAFPAITLAPMSNIDDPR